MWSTNMKAAMVATAREGEKIKYKKKSNVVKEHESCYGRYGVWEKNKKKITTYFTTHSMYTIFCTNDGLLTT